MNKETVERWMEPRFVPVLLVVTVVFLLALGGGLPRGIAQDARMLFGAAGDVSRFVTHLMVEAERYFEDPQNAEHHHIASASVAPACPSAAADRGNPVAPARAQISSLRGLEELHINLDAMNDSLLIQLERLNVQEWPPLEVLEDYPFLRGDVRVHVVRPARAPQREVVM